MESQLQSTEAVWKKPIYHENFYANMFLPLLKVVAWIVYFHSLALKAGNGIIN